MKSYVINRPDATDRLARFQAAYPSCLPPCTVWRAKTGEDVTPPAWWKSTANRWALVENFMDIWSIGEDVLIFEDDCIFCDNFAKRYNDFMLSLPPDAGMIYLGAQHYIPPRMVTSNVLKIKVSWCGHAILYKTEILTRLLDYFRLPNWSCGHYSDQRKAQACLHGLVTAYAPLVNLCGQMGGFSYLNQDDRPLRWYNAFAYYDMSGKIRWTPELIELMKNRRLLPSQG